MNVLLITYAHRVAGKDYGQFFEAIKANGANWWHYLDATWIVATTHSAHDFASLLYPHMDSNDHLLVVRITAEQQGWLPADAWRWLNERIY